MAGYINLKLLGITPSDVDRGYNLGKSTDDVAYKLIRDDSADMKDQSIPDKVQTDTSAKLDNDDDSGNVEEKCKPTEVRIESDPDTLSSDNDFTNVLVKYVSGEVQLRW